MEEKHNQSWNSLGLGLEFEDLAGGKYVGPLGSGLWQTVTTHSGHKRAEFVCGGVGGGSLRYCCYEG